MIIPGLTPAGAQQDVFKPERQTKTTAAAGVPNESLSELPVEADQQPEQQSRQAQDKGMTGDASQLPDEAVDSDGAGSDGADLPRKGLMVDIRA